MKQLGSSQTPNIALKQGIWLGPPTEGLGANGAKKHAGNTKQVRSKSISLVTIKLTGFVLVTFFDV